jgi:tripartite-type tricarboxylate transporter receptor subunit TctC
MKIARPILLSLFILFSGAAAHGQSFYQGKTIRVVVGYLAGDSHDQISRVTTRYMGKYIAGNPDFVVQNMPGAGAMIAANHVYNLTKPDGLTLGTISGGLYFAQLTGRQEVKFDWRKFTWIGSPDHNGHVLFIRTESPYKTLEDIRRAKEPPKCSATGVGSSSHDVPKILEDTLGLRFRVITGYPGGGEQDLAMERGEVHCRAISTESYFSREPFLTWLKKGVVRILLQTSRERDPRIADVPTIYELMDKYKTPPEKKKLAIAYLGVGAIGQRPMVSTPGVPPDRAKILRQAYANALKDPEFAEEAKKRGWEVTPVAGDQLEVIAKEVIDQPPEVVEWLKKLLGQ